MEKQPTKQASVWRDIAWLQLSGPGAEEFLQGYLTSDSRRINALGVTPMALCTLKGRVLASGWALSHEEGVALLVHQSLAERVTEFLKPYVTFSKCRLETIHGAVLVDADGEYEFLEGLRLSLTTQPPDAATDVSDTINARLIAAEFVLISTAVSEQFLPQMLSLDQAGAIDFDKGCYLGQEIVARAQHRGEIKRRLKSFAYEGSTPTLGEGFGELDCVVAVATNGTALAVSKV